MLQFTVDHIRNSDPSNGWRIWTVPKPKNRLEIFHCQSSSPKSTRCLLFFYAGNTWKVPEVQWFPWWTHEKCMVLKEYIHWNMLTFTFPKAIRLESPNLRAYVGVIFGKLIWLGMMYFPYWEAIWEPLLKSNKITKISWGVTWIEETAACWKSWKGRVCHGAAEIWVLESGIPSKRGSHDKVTTAVLPPKQQVFFLYILSEMFPPRFWG